MIWKSTFCGGQHEDVSARHEMIPEIVVGSYTHEEAMTKDQHRKGIFGHVRICSGGDRWIMDHRTDVPVPIGIIKSDIARADRELSRRSNGNGKNEEQDDR